MDPRDGVSGPKKWMDPRDGVSGPNGEVYHK